MHIKENHKTLIQAKKENPVKRSLRKQTKIVRKNQLVKQSKQFQVQRARALGSELAKQKPRNKNQYTTQ